MPLLKKKPFVKNPLSDFPDDNELVYYCEITQEIFRDYEQFCDRIILCNSMVWSCSMTGKSGLTYREALESEENARNNLKDFPNHLKVPILFLATKTKRTAFGDMVDDVFTFAKDRFFIGETVEASFAGSKWKESHILQVVAPNEEQIRKHKKNGQTNTERHIPASLYRYEVEQLLDPEDEDVSEIIVVNFEHIRRKKGTYTRERNKIFLKYHVEQNENGIWVIKNSIIQEYGLHKIKFEQIFDGPLPDFSSIKRSVKHTDGGKKPKQETLAKFLTKNNVVSTSQKNKENKNSNILEIMKQKEMEYKKMKEDMKQKKAEEKLAERLKRKEENIKISSILRDWYKPKDDLELEDHKKLPPSTSIESKIPEKYLGDVFMILEFVYSFNKLLYVNKFFHGGLSFELMERALLEKEVAGPLIDLIQMLLSALFNLQDEEASQYRTNVENTSEVKDEDWKENLSLTKASTLATVASKWSSTYQGLPIGRLPLYSLTTSEILRLHLLGSGARINETGARWRYQQRGGYTSEDDPGLYLRLHHPHILKALAYSSISELPMGDKLKIINCLINQILTYADVRDLIEERLEKSRQAKQDLKTAQTAERKREQEYLAEKVKIKREGKENNKDITAELEKLEKDVERKKAELDKKIKKLTKMASEYQVFLGYDRAYRRYLKLESIPGLFIEFNEENAGQCLAKVVPQIPNLIDADRTQTLLHLRKIHEGVNGDKENNSEDKSVVVNGFRESPITDDSCKELLLCSADPTTCIVHSSVVKKQRWGFYHTEEQLNTLLVALNRRGIRENELLQTLQIQKENLETIIAQTPVSQLNHNLEAEEHEQKAKLKSQKKPRYEDANLGYSTTMEIPDVLEALLVDNILEMEEKISAGNLGSLPVKDREAWRSNLQHREYDKMDKTVIRKNGFKNMNDKVKNEERGSRSNTPEISTKAYSDPGYFLGPTLDIESEDSDEADALLLCPTEKLKCSVQSLATALLQVAHSVDPKYLKKPLGHADVKNADIRKKDFDFFDQWEQSLTASTSYSQVFLHYGTLDSCVMWSRSALLARCRICRRQKDSENMLLCDNCNCGHHLYCLKPKLTSIPQGDWFCDRCMKEKEKEAEAEKEKERLQRKRVIFKDEEIAEEEEMEEHQDEEDEEMEEDDSNSKEDEESSKEDQEMDENENTDSDADSDNIKVNGHIIIEVCEACGSGGELLCCDNCPAMYHLECVEPPLRRVPRGQWFCNKCKVKKRRDEDDSDSSDIPLGRKINRRETDAREDLPLHNVALQELLSDVLKNDDAWPFLRPVQKYEVPDYYDIITKPMDFGTIKYKLNMGEYKCDADLMADAVLVFENCRTYNDSDSEVFKCGMRVLRFFIKKARSLSLKLPEEMKDEDEEEVEDSPPNKRQKTK